MTVRNGRRCSAADAYLRPALARKNLTVEVRALATRLLFDGTRTNGVEYFRHGRTVTARAEREVILCGGVINSPQLLMLSGIGDPEELSAHDIGVKVALSGVGKNLQDHISATIAYLRKEPGPFHRAMRFDRIVPALARAYLFGKGVAADLPTGQMAFLKSRPDVALPDVQLIFHAAPLTATPYLMPFRRPYADSYACRAVVLRPESRGRLKLVSSDPRTPVRIRQNFLATESDWRTFRAALRMSRDVCRQTPMQPSWNAKRRRASVLSPMPILMPTSAAIPSPSTIRLAPARWGPCPTAWPSSIRRLAFLASRAFASLMARRCRTSSAATSMRPSS
jgi:choline dehydrogenase/4-pyridoxate dehydrogenase